MNTSFMDVFGKTKSKTQKLGELENILIVYLIEWNEGYAVRTLVDTEDGCGVDTMDSDGWTALPLHFKSVSSIKVSRFYWEIFNEAM